MKPEICLPSASLNRYQNLFRIDWPVTQQITIGRLKSPRVNGGILGAIHAAWEVLQKLRVACANS